jgi:hypothetical protein
MAAAIGSSISANFGRNRIGACPKYEVGVSYRLDSNRQNLVAMAMLERGDAAATPVHEVDGQNTEPATIQCRLLPKFSASELHVSAAERWW